VAARPGRLLHEVGQRDRDQRVDAGREVEGEAEDEDRQERERKAAGGQRAADVAGEEVGLCRGVLRGGRQRSEVAGRRRGRRRHTGRRGNLGHVDVRSRFIGREADAVAAGLVAELRAERGRAGGELGLEADGGRAVVHRQLLAAGELEGLHGVRRIDRIADELRPLEGEHGRDRELLGRLVRVDVPAVLDLGDDRSFHLVAGALLDRAGDRRLAGGAAGREVDLGEDGNGGEDGQQDRDYGFLHFGVARRFSMLGRTMSTLLMSGEFGKSFLKLRNSFAAPSRLPCWM